MNQTYIVLDSWTESYENPISIEQGEEVIVDPSVIEPDPEWANWVCCIASNNRDGWVPIQILKIMPSNTNDRYNSMALEDYSAYELTVKTGDFVYGNRILNGWLWCSKENDNKKGWVPLRNLKLIP